MEIIFLKNPTWRTFCETTVAIAAISYLKLDWCYGRKLANPKLLTYQSLIFFMQPFGKYKGGWGVGGGEEVIWTSLD